MCGLPLVLVSRGCSLAGGVQAPHCRALSSCRARARGKGALVSDTFLRN